MAKGVTSLTATIASSGTTSDTITVPSNKCLLGFRTPAAFTGTAVSFLMMHESTDTAAPIYNAGTLLSETVATNQAEFHPMNPQNFRGVRFVQVKINGTEGASRSILLVFGEE